MTPKDPKTRLDQLLVARGLVESRNKAQGLIMAGQVRVSGERVDKTGALVPTTADIELAEPQRFVSRGGFKLEGALGHFGLDPGGLVCLDVGASTGGFTDCLLQRGALLVYAVDVGRGQIHARIAEDQRVVVMDKTNAHYPFALPQRVQLIVVDVSFISLTQVLPNVVTQLSPGGRVLCLVKPQFEAGKNQVGHGGVVRDPRVHGAVLTKIGLWAVESGIRARGFVRSTLLGPSGNVEFFVLLQLA